MSRSSTWMSGSMGFVLGLACSAGLAVASQLTPLEAAAQLVISAQQHAYEVDRLVDAVQERQLRAELKRATRELNADLDLLQRTVDTQRYRPPVRPERPERPAPPVVVVTSDAELSGILGAIQAEAFSSDKLALLGSAAAGRAFTTSQVIRVMGAFAFDSDKIEAAAMLYPLVVDRQDWYLTSAALTFSSSKETLRQRTSP